MGDHYDHTTPSNHGISGSVLIHALGLVKNEEVEPKDRRTHEAIWMDLEETIDPTRSDWRTIEEQHESCETALQLLTDAMNEAAENELEFEKNIFEALEESLEQCGLTRKVCNPEQMILLRTDGHRAIGIVRQFDITRSLRGDGETSFALPDLCTCLLENENGSWMVKDCFAMVEFKKGDSQFKDLNGTTIDLKNKHGALCQVLMYTIKYGLPFHARRGLFSDNLPFTVIAGQIDGANPNNHWCCRYLYGSIVPPNALGDRFTYTIDEHGYGSQMDQHTMKRVVSVLLETLVFGIGSAVGVWNYPDLPPVSASGRMLLLSGLELYTGLLPSRTQHAQRNALNFVASPIPGTNHLVGGLDWNVSQGDFFSGTLQLQSILDPMDETRYLIFTETSANQYVDVLVKVTSMVAHRPLVTSGVAFEALKCVRGIADPTLQRELSTLLFAIIDMDAGLITIMTDLTKQGYDVLKPRSMLNSQISMRAIWNGFKVLVMDVLLPMANQRIVHPDIRPGFDVTSNVLWKLYDGGKMVKKVLIDIESLVHVRFWSTDDTAMYIPLGNKWNAKTFVVWQCVAVAYAWSQQLDQYGGRGELCMNMNELLSEIGGGRLPLLLPEIRDIIIAECKGEMSKEAAVRMISFLDSLFEEERVIL